MTASAGDYAAGTAALLQFLREQIQAVVPDEFQSLISLDKEPDMAAAGAKRVIDAVDAYRENKSKLQNS